VKRLQLHRKISEHPELLDRLSDSKTAEMLRLHYIDGVEWQRIAAIYHYSIENIYVLRRKAVEELQRIIESEVN